jgi:hypothetical protein
MGINSDGTTLIDNGLFENIGAVTWDTTAKTSGFTGVSGNGYFVNTSGGVVTANLPASPSAGDIVGIKDYANTADTNNITIGRNGSNINGDAADYVINVEGLSAILVYIDGTQGWLITNSSQASDIAIPPAFVTATGGTITTSGDFKIHTFTGPGTLCVSSAGNACGSNAVDYLTVAGGGGGAANSNGAGGAGAGGFRTSFPSPAGTVPVTVQGYPITVGGGGAGHVGDPENAGNGVSGSNSIFSSFTSAGGGGGGGAGAGVAGGSGGGAGQGIGSGGAGNTPPVSPSQGNPGAAGAPGERGAGGGGAGAAGSSVTGGNGLANSITGSAITRGGGGGGGARNVSPGNGAGGSGGGGAGACAANGVAGTVNTGGGGGGAGRNTGTGLNNTGGAGGSGIVIIRYKFQ